MSSWKECKLGDVAEIIGGGTPSTSNNEFWNGNIPWLTPRDLTGYSKVYISHGERFITESGLKNSSAKLMPKGTVLLTSRAPIGYVVIAENGICTNQGFKSLVPNFEILNTFGQIGVKFELITAYEKNRLVETQVIIRCDEFEKVEKYFE